MNDGQAVYDLLRQAATGGPLPIPHPSGETLAWLLINRYVEILDENQIGIRTQLSRQGWRLLYLTSKATHCVP